MNIAVADSPASLVELFVGTSAQDHPETLTLDGVVASLQLLLAARRASRNEDLAHWHNISRGM